MAASIGEKLRLEREAHGIALRDISEQTRISMRYLEAIESDDYRRLPGGIFNRSFIRAYAKFVGFDEQEAIEEYNRTLLEHGESTDDSAGRTVRSQVYTDDGAQNRSPLRMTPGKTPAAKQSGHGIHLPLEIEIAKEGRHEFTV